MEDLDITGDSRGEDLEFKIPQLVVMLTYNDYTVNNAEFVFEECRDTQARYWGMKEKPISLERMKALYTRMKECGKITVLEVVAYDENDALDGVGIAIECGCDILMGTKFYESVADICKMHGIKYMPFIGDIEGRPSVLRGTETDIIRQAVHAIKAGAFGVDLLGYRYEGNIQSLNKAVSTAVNGKVCIAGSVDSYTRLDEVIEAAPMFFTIGSAFFDNKFDGTIPEQIDKVCKYILKNT